MLVTTGDVTTCLQLPRLEAGEVQLHGVEDMPAWLCQIVADSTREVLAAAQQEARARPNGFGKHILVRLQHPKGILAPPGV